MSEKTESGRESEERFAVSVHVYRCVAGCLNVVSLKFLFLVNLFILFYFISYESEVSLY
jgi:hypothetical protein